MRRIAVDVNQAVLIAGAGARADVPLVKVGQDLLPRASEQRPKDPRGAPLFRGTWVESIPSLTLLPSQSM